MSKKIPPCRGYEFGTVELTVLADDVPIRFVSGIEFDEIDLPEWESANLGTLWAIPQTMQVSFGYLEPEFLELLYGRPVVPLCSRQIPAEGIE